VCLSTVSLRSRSHCCCILSRSRWRLRVSLLPLPPLRWADRESMSWPLLSSMITSCSLLITSLYIGSWWSTCCCSTSLSADTNNLSDMPPNSSESHPKVFAQDASNWRPSLKNPSTSALRWSSFFWRVLYCRPTAPNFAWISALEAGSLNTSHSCAPAASASASRGRWPSSCRSKFSIFLSCSSGSLSNGRSSSWSDIPCSASLSLFSPASNSRLVSTAAPKLLARSSRRPSKSAQRCNMDVRRADKRWASGASGSKRARIDSPTSDRWDNCGCWVRNSSLSTWTCCTWLCTMRESDKIGPRAVIMRSFALNQPLKLSWVSWKSFMSSMNFILSLHRSWRIFQRETTSFSSSCKLSAPRAPSLRRNKSFTWLFVLSSRDCFSYISSTMVFICFAILSASSLVWGTISFGRFRWTLSRNWPRLRRLSKCFFTSSRMPSSSAWRSERRTPSRLYRLLISVNCCCTGDSSSRWKPSWEERRLLNPLEPPGETGLWMEKPPLFDLVGEGDLVSWDVRRNGLLVTEVLFVGL